MVYRSYVSCQMLQAMPTKANSSSPGRDQDALTLNIAASVGVVSALLCALSVHGVGAHRVGVITQVSKLLALDSDVVCFFRSNQVNGACKSQHVSTYHTKSPAYD